VDRDSVAWATANPWEGGHIAACTPPTGGVWPMTVACLFDNIRILHSSSWN
jgi:5,10-methylene-tetrahydrofolate dehydrogenase/methenyl tetrahydrofolate cyclohydrolase